MPPRLRGHPEEENVPENERQEDNAPYNDIPPAFRALIRESIAAGVAAGLAAAQARPDAAAFAEPRLKDYVISKFESLDNNCSPAELRAWKDNIRLAKGSMPNQLRTSLNRVAFMKEHMTVAARNRWESKCQSAYLASLRTDNPTTYESLHDDTSLYTWVDNLQKDAGNFSQTYTSSLLEARQGESQSPMEFDTYMEGLEVAQGTLLAADNERANAFHARLRPWLRNQLNQNYMAQGLPRSRNQMVSAAQRIWDQMPLNRRQNLEAEFSSSTSSNPFSQSRSQGPNNLRPERNRDTKFQNSSSPMRPNNFRGQSGRPGAPTRDRTASTRPAVGSGQKTNPVDANGDPTRCLICGSIFHYSPFCPDKPGRPRDESDKSSAPKPHSPQNNPPRNPRYTTKAVTGKRKSRSPSGDGEVDIGSGPPLSPEFHETGNLSGSEDDEPQDR